MSYIDNLIYHKSMIESQKTLVVNQIIKLLEEILPNINGFTEIATQNNINKVVSDIKKVIDEQFKTISPELQKKILELGYYESDFQESLLESTLLNNSTIAVASTSKELIKTAIFKTPIEGLLFKDGLNRLNSDVKKQVETAIRISILNGETAKQAKKRIRGNYTIAEHRMTSFIRTSIQSATNIATMETYKNNDVKKFRYCAILDNRTTKLCKSLNGKIFDLSDNSKIPPLHYNCRSFIVPILDDDIEEELNKTYSKWLKDAKIKDFDVNENGDFKENHKTLIPLSKLKAIEEKRLNVKI